MIYLSTFARPKGSKDKKKRKRRVTSGQVILGSGAIGAGLGGVKGTIEFPRFQEADRFFLKPTKQEVTQAVKNLSPKDRNIARGLGFSVGALKGLATGVIGATLGTALYRGIKNRKKLNKTDRNKILTRALGYGLQGALIAGASTALTKRKDRLRHLITKRPQDFAKSMAKSGLVFGSIGGALETNDRINRKQSLSPYIEDTINKYIIK